MKLLSTLLFAATLAFASLPGRAQTNPPPPSTGNPAIDGLANIPNSTFLDATWTVQVGVVLNNNSTGTGAGLLENRVELGYIFHTNFFVWGAIQNNAGSGILNLGGGGLGLRKAWSTAEVYGKLGVEYSGLDKHYSAVTCFGSAYTPFANGTSGILARTSVFAEEHVVKPFSGGPAFLRTVFGMRLNF